LKHTIRMSKETKNKYIPPLNVGVDNIKRMLKLCGYDIDNGFIYLFIECIQQDITKGDKTTLSDITKIQKKVDLVINKNPKEKGKKKSKKKK